MFAKEAICEHPARLPLPIAAADDGRMTRRRRLPTFFRPAEAETLLAALRSEQHRLIILTGLFLGLRVSEITHLDVADVDCDRGTVLVRHGKGDRDRQVPMPHRLWEGLRAWIGERKAGYLFPSPRGGGRLSSRSVQRLIKRAAGRAGIAGVDVPRKITPHKLRHTYATRLLDTGANIREVQELLGHASVATTEIYCHVSGDRLRGAVDRL